MGILWSSTQESHLRERGRCSGLPTAYAAGLHTGDKTQKGVSEAQTCDVGSGTARKSRGDLPLLFYDTIVSLSDVTFNNILSSA